MRHAMQCLVLFGVFAALAACGGGGDCDCAAYPRCPDPVGPVPVKDVGIAWWVADGVQGTAEVVGDRVELRYADQGVDHLVIYDVVPNDSNAAKGTFCP